jgi:hypothetical protein
MKVIIRLKSIITCPNCNFKKEEVMPVNTCLCIYECENCNKEIRPEKGNCCVFCTHGNVQCPPTQQLKLQLKKVKQ